MQTTIERAVEILGGQSRAAALLGVSPQAVYLWVRQSHKGKPVPAERVLEIERATNRQVTRHELRPDLYPVEDATTLNANSIQALDPDAVGCP